MAFLCLAYTLCGYVWWIAYILAALWAQASYILSVILISGLVAVSCVHLMAAVIRISATIVVVAHTIEMLSIWYLAPNSASERLNYVMFVAILGLFTLLVLRIICARLHRIFQLKDENNLLIQRLKQQNTQLAQANVSQSRYLSAASHDLRQPLHALALITHEVQRKNKDKTIDPSLKRIEQAIDSLSDSFNAMLNLSRLDSGVYKPDFRTFAIQNSLDRIIVEYEAAAQQKGLSLQIVPSRVWLHSDESMVYSILSNFVSNALRYTNEGGLLVGVRHMPKGRVKLMVYDTGVGIPAEKTTHIFQEYYRLEYAEQRVKGGVGLGLAISERMAKLLNTELTVRSQLGQGSAFGLILPVAEKDDSDRGLEQKNEAFADVLVGKRVALLEDDSIIAEHIEELLISWHVDVTLVLSTEMLLETIEDEGYFDLIISDFHLGLPDETGLDVLMAAQTAQHAQQANYVLLTGDTTGDLIETAEQQGLHVLHKPVSPARLRAFLNSLCHS
ncbi:MAG: ATP-binding response regulator [Formosimonas sp.]